MSTCSPDPTWTLPDQTRTQQKSSALGQLYLCCSRSDASPSSRACSLHFSFPTQQCVQPLNSRCAVVKISPTPEPSLFHPNRRGEPVVTHSEKANGQHRMYYHNRLSWLVPPGHWRSQAEGLRVEEAVSCRGYCGCAAIHCRGKWMIVSFPHCLLQHCCHVSHITVANMPDSSLHFANLNELNYAEWSLYMWSMLIKKKLWKVVEGSETCPLGSPNSKAVKAFECCQAEAHTEIVLHLKLPQLLHAHSTDPYVFWEELQHMHCTQGFDTHMTLCWRFNMMTKHADQSMSSWIADVQQAVFHLKEVRYTATDEDKILVLTQSLPPLYDPFIISLNAAIAVKYMGPCCNVYSHYHFWVLHLPSHPLPSIATPPLFHCNTSPPPLQHLSCHLLQQLSPSVATTLPLHCNSPPHPLQQLSSATAPSVASIYTMKYCNILLYLPSHPPPSVATSLPSIATPLLPCCNTASICCNTSLAIYCNTTPHLLQHLPPATPTHLLHLHPFVPCHSWSMPCLSVDGCMLLYGHILQVCCFH